MKCCGICQGECEVARHDQTHCPDCGHTTEPWPWGGAHSEDDPTCCYECGRDAEPCLTRGEPA